MCPVTLAALFGLAASACALDGPSTLLAPADPRIATRWAAPPSPVMGLKQLKPVEPKDWRDLNHDAMPKDGMNRDRGGEK